MNDRLRLSAETAPDAIEELPPSGKLVLTVLAHEGSLTQSELASETLLPARTVRYALNQLEDLDLVASQISFADARQNVYAIESDRFLESNPR